MAGKLPAYRLVLGRLTVGVLWEGVSKSGTHYHSGTLDVTALKKALQDAQIKKQQVRINAAGETAEHDVTRIAMFDAQKKNGARSVL